MTLTGERLQAMVIEAPHRHNTYSRITFFLFGVVFVYSSMTTDERTPKENLFRAGLIVAGFLTMIGLSERKKQPYESWMPSVMKGFTVTYALFLILIVQQSYEQAKYTWNIIEPAVPEERARQYFATWQTNCELSWKNLSNKLDRYSAAHLIGWVLHAVLIRDYPVMHLWSILTELVEMLFGEVIPPLAECWWDQLICDMFLTNLPGMLIGMGIIKFFGWQKFDWLGRNGVSGFREWKIWKSHKKILALFLLLLGYTIQFLGCFFVPNAFHTSPISNFSAVRLYIWFCVGHAAFKELYDYSCEDIHETTTVGGHFGQIGMTVMLSEITIIIKHYNNSVIQFKGSFGVVQRVIWPIVLTVYLIWYLYSLTHIPKRRALALAAAKIDLASGQEIEQAPADNKKQTKASEDKHLKAEIGRAHV